MAIFEPPANRLEPLVGPLQPIIFTSRSPDVGAALAKIPQAASSQLGRV